jgi:hypothetical protein
MAHRFGERRIRLAGIDGLVGFGGYIYRSGYFAG